MKDGLHSINLIIDGTQYEYSQGDFIKLCEGELPAQENVLRHVLRLQKIAADNVAAELRRLRDEVKEYQFTIEEMKKEKRKVKSRYQKEKEAADDMDGGWGSRGH